MIVQALYCIIVKEFYSSEFNRLGHFKVIFYPELKMPLAPAVLPTCQQTGRKPFSDLYQSLFLISLFCFCNIYGIDQTCFFALSATDAFRIINYYCIVFLVPKKCLCGVYIYAIAFFCVVANLGIYQYRHIITRELFLYIYDSIVVFIDAQKIVV